MQAGAKVYISSRKAKDCEETAAKLNALGPGQCISLPADLQDMNQIKQLVSELSKREKRKKSSSYFFFHYLLFNIYY